MKRYWILLVFLIPASGCALLPEVAHEPQFHNPFPQLQKVAVAPFFNLSTEKTVDGRQFANAYYNELQLVPGFEVAPVGVTEKMIEAHGLQINKAEDCRRLAQLLEVDAVVVGAVTDFSPYYPPRCGMRVEWYAANPGFHPIPAGYGLPWGTTQEEYIPQSLRFEAEMALARAQLKTQSPDVPPGAVPPAFVPPAGPAAPSGPEELPPPTSQSKQTGTARLRRNEQPSAPAGAAADKSPAAKTGSQQLGDARSMIAPRALAAPLVGDFPPDWPDARAFVPASPQCQRPDLVLNNEPVMHHTRVYNGHDADFTCALKNYVSFRDDARFGGWQSYLQRSDDFIRFCCYKHIAEMLTARGGAGESRVVWRWPVDR